METCRCYNSIREKFGVTKTQAGYTCNNCAHLIPETAEIETISVTSGNQQNRNSPTLVTSSKLNVLPGLSGINSIVMRMWIWISIQALIIGVWAGNAFPDEGYYTSSFSFGNFILGVLIGIGAFAPLVFVVEALREIVRSIVQGKQND